MKDVEYLINNGVNIKASLELFGDISVYNDTLEVFAVEFLSKVEKLKEYKEKADMDNYAIIVHSIKSDARYFGFDALADIAYIHEQESKENKLFSITEKFDDFMREAVRVNGIVITYLGKMNVENTLTMPAIRGINDVVLHKTILIVDDSDIIRTYITNIFKNDFEILLATDGEEAIKIIESTGSKIVGMLLDLNMPNVNGFEVLEYFKENRLFSKIGVGIITGNDSKDTIVKAFEYPIIDVLNKPFNEESVKTVVNKIMYSVEQ